jgi:glycosyltransferase involved in cell wall biosynthesis
MLCRNTWVRTPMASANPVKHWLQRQLAGRVASLSITNPHDASAWPQTRRRDDVPYPVDVAFWSEPTPRQPTFWTDRGWTTPTGPVLGYVSNLLPRKAQIELIQWLSPLLAQRPATRLALVGNSFDDDYVRQLRATIIRRGLQDQVLVMGGLDPEGVRQFFAWTDVHIVNTTSETQCMAVFESLAAGVATVIRDIPALTEAFPGLPAHNTEGELCSNVARLLDVEGARGQLVATSAERLEWADVRRHDRLVLDRCTEWGLL